MINPTRMNLIATKRRMAMARKGHSVLKRKREVLVIEFLKLLRDSKGNRDELNALMQKAYRSVTLASAYVGDFELESTALHVPEAERIGITLKGVMGVQVPEVLKAARIGKANYSFMSTSIAVDDINGAFGDALDAVVDVAQRELGLKRLVLEIEKAKRRVNALEYKLMPELNGRSRYITMRLDEIDRDSFSALKHVKRRLARQQNASSYAPDPSL